MQLQNPEKNQQLQTLIAKANEATAAFNQLQTKATEIKTNIDRNKKTIEALKAENAELQAKSDKVTVSDTGEVSFSEFDDYSEQIFANVRKIKALENVIDKFGKELELLILDKAQQAYSDTEVQVSNVFDFYAKHFLDELLNEEILNKLNTVFYLLRMSRTSNKAEPRHFILETLKNKLDRTFVVERAALNNITFPSVNFYGYSDGDVITRVRKINELKKQLGKE